MAGPTTEILNEDVKELKDEVHRLAIGLAEIRTELRVLVGVAKWGLSVIATTLLGGTIDGLWWASSINSEVGHLGNEIHEIRKLKAEPAVERRPPEPPKAERVEKPENPPVEAGSTSKIAEEARRNGAASGTEPRL